MRDLDWYTHYTVDRTPLRLKDTTLHSFDLNGIYVIYRAGTLSLPPRVVRVGQGNIGACMRSHSADVEITIHGDLNVAIALELRESIRNGAERYLSNVYRPLVGNAFPNVEPIAVSLPLAA
jgi:hypothetical protein